MTKRDQRIAFHVTEDFKERLREAAERRSASMSEIARRGTARVIEDIEG